MGKAHCDMSMKQIFHRQKWLENVMYMTSLANAAVTQAVANLIGQ
jgi:hypothetical protein